MNPRRLALFAPMAVLLLLFLMSVGKLFWSSFLQGGASLYYGLVTDPVTLGVLWRTVWIALVTTAICAVLGYPLALFLARSPRRNLWMILVISPWLVSIVVRTFGWMVILGNRGFLNTTLHDMGLTTTPIRLLYTPTAVIIGLVHVLMPFMVIATLSSLLQQDRQLEEASRILGGTRWQTFRRVTLPLSLPGLIGGCSLVLLMGTGSIVTPLLLGGLRDRMLGTQIYNDIFQVYNFDRATAMAILLLVVALVLVAPLRLLETRVRRHQDAN